MADRAGEPIAIIGMNMVFPKSRDVFGYWENLLSGADLTSEVPAGRWRYGDHCTDALPGVPAVQTRKIGALPALRINLANLAILPNQLSAIDPSQLISLFVAKSLFDDLIAHDMNAMNLRHNSAP